MFKEGNEVDLTYQRTQHIFTTDSPCDIVMVAECPDYQQHAINLNKHPFHGGKSPVF